MGSAASVSVVQQTEKINLINEEQTREISGLYWDFYKKTFHMAKDSNGYISNNIIEKFIKSHRDRMKAKFSDVASDPFERDLWEPLIESNYYSIVLASLFSDYNSESSMKSRQSLLLESIKDSGIDADELKCRGCCRSDFRHGRRCNPLQIDTQDTTNCVWKDFENADPDDVAVHLWSYSMSTGMGDSLPAFYKRLNMAILNDDYNKIKDFSIIICGLIRWIKNHSSMTKETITLYRGTPINEKQKHNVGNALNPRFQFTDFVSTDDTIAYNEAKEKSKALKKKAETIFRMPMFVAASENIKKAQEFCWLQENGISSPILEFKVSQGCDTVASIM